VRELARELGIDLAGVDGTGPQGTVLARDVARAFRGGGAADAGWEPLRGARRAMAEAMARSHAEVAPATVHDEAPVGRWRGRGDITARLVRALCAGAAAEPALNAWFDAARGRILHAAVHLGVAVDGPDGLLVPVLRDASSLDATAVRAAIDRLAAAARARTLAPADLHGATITLSNYGSVGGWFATPIVSPPQVAILGAGRIRDDRLPLSLTYDHRAATGGEAARFLAAVIDDLAQEV
jgi:pyruvate dehydrogenase E2 component (dihydrolipoamide acetyltransferase)